ncbi:MULTISPECIES: MarR family winged helix-turn-helix transcriptional regulator [Micromonospora]|uniref:MarR family transcriptional regulator n=1 Tax=Micromonospora solifontis TaxID=2487138 RepID=A0ABX9WPA0_9ACTN|nr:MULTISPECIES: MarR family transcriptional regulator [Micromonospora]NES14820.1 MarR family transcriptional regulator [Micromonospora sp. PPF5-17B]NES35384.1 MarR family transcriptional regulator [Micromonospora solifontis]NES56134.1 MarR family transcriptional regulator [Micromonospora sp. PPF5-6]RNM00876.1 MarR family transcriptional regulator [Micromonospora solifontis]
MNHPNNLGLELHTLVSRLDRAGDRILRANHGLSYRRFMVLVMVGELGASTQRELADSLAVTEPSVSRMIAALAGTGLLTVAPDPAGGNRRRIALTDSGRTLVNRAGTELIQRLTQLVESSGVPFETYLAHTRRLNAALQGS